MAGQKLMKLNLVRQHRRFQYFHAINKVIDGKASPGYATERFNKLKEIEGRVK